MPLLLLLDTLLQSPWISFLLLFTLVFAFICLDFLKNEFMLLDFKATSVVCRFAQKGWQLFLVMALYVLTNLQVTIGVAAAYLRTSFIEMLDLVCSVLAVSHRGVVF